MSKQENIINEHYTVHYAMEEPWTGDPYPFPKSRDFSSKAEAIKFANDLYNDDDPLLDKSEVDVTYSYCIPRDPKMYRIPYKWETEKVKWR